MSLGGGVFLTQNKVSPGTYINFVSAAKASATISDRGIAAMALELDWGKDGEIFAVESADLQKNSMALFGYDYTSDKLNGLKDLFLNAKMLYVYRLNSGEKATCTLADARYSGVRGNELKIAVAVSADDENLFEVTTFLDGVAVDEQVVSGAAELTDNDYVVFQKDAVLEESAGLALTGGTNGEVTGAVYQTFLDKLEAYRFHTLGCVSTEDSIKELFAVYTKRMRDEVGVKFQTVLYQQGADYEGVINVKNPVTDEGANEASLVYWVTGKSAGCPINESNINKVYNGNFTVKADYTQKELEAAAEAGEFVLHQVGEEIRVFMDINSFVSHTVNKSADFQSNQIVRVLDQMGNDIAALFNDKYLGLVQNNAAGRLAFWNEIVTYNREMEKLGAIENFVADDVVVEAGNTKESVVVTNPVTPVMAMEKLYMTIIVQ